MSLYVVDANVVAKWFVPEPLSEECSRLLDERHELAAPDLLWPELGSVLWKKTRAGELRRGEASRILRALDAVPLTLFPSRSVLEGALEIALATSRSVYDSVYLALAVALGCPLVTADERLVLGLGGRRLSRFARWVGDPE